MKMILTILTAAVFAVAIGWLAFNQRQVQQRLAAVQTENQRLADELAQRPVISPEALARIESRLKDSQAALTIAEQRLTNTMASIAALSTAAQQAPMQFMSARVTSRVRGPSMAQEFIPGVPRPPASSHSPAGELLSRSWGPEQVVGQPNTDRNGDIPTAWASMAPDGGEEWLHVNYDRPVDISEIRIRETYNPGAISKIVAVLPNGQEAPVWEGVEPPGEAPVDTSFRPRSNVQASSVKVYLDTRRVPGWNEIDAIELIGSDGSRQWASSATASSTYAER
ncbi:MAG: hypothetical protein L0Y58_11345 [Verrucomicrobia subdivision 3 bacterium]|nr:hypothetical protein [Limisphaerales bacterium]